MSPRRPTAEPAAPEQVQAAADLFEARQSGAAEPEGAWRDRVWLPSERERRPCCSGLTPDRLKDPQKLKSHCRTLHHVAAYFDLDSRLLRAELRRRRQARERAGAASGSVGSLGADLGPRRVRPTSAARLAPEEPASTEAAALHARLVRLVADKRADLGALARRAGETCAELARQLEDEGQAVEVILAETGAVDLAADLKTLIDDIQHLVITRDTLRRVL